MRTSSRAITSVVVFVVGLLNVCQTTNADTPVIQGHKPPHAILAEPTTPYKLKLSLEDNWNFNPMGSPRVTVTLASSSHHTLAFFLTSALSNLTVEYQPAKDNTVNNTSWRMLKSSREVPSDTASPHQRPSSLAFNILMKLSPGQEDKTDYDLGEFPMSPEGFYRITAFTKLSNVSEQDGPESSPVLVRSFELNLRSNSIVVRRTATGFAQVPAAAEKQALPK